MINTVSINPLIPMVQKNNAKKENKKPSKIKEYTDTFVSSSKITLPTSIVIAGLWSVFEHKKYKAQMIPNLISNISIFASANLIFSAIDSFFKILRQDNNNHKKQPINFS